tara:strand:+ start:58 stop:504 length:447 start_codon:yes stop_codon:yes gene_type:complete
MANPFALKVLRIGAKTIKKVVKKNKSKYGSKNKGMYNPSTRSYHGKKGAQGDMIPNDLATRPKPGSRGTLRETAAEKKARKIKKQDDLGVIRGKGPKVSQSDLPSTGSTYAKPKRGGMQMDPGSLRITPTSTPKQSKKILKEVLGIKS